ncbi:polyprenol phosphomannose-dependent alpha 1,6 mannosyltransferase MptB [Williamsia sp. CHRR-6]|uniref:polyprenol phosphomannose-dependent alpha 1,6 mannosyltransferase MptB n=1 Tax=Williamsia sp. CHRR-6 TaxID=2835871 RepID=UPI001BDA2FB5|nr:polyprenol phosphomannose-dependent alpha 1,6 mannosyltransferase MptB [Williamsia sp. CHRR-6]MBT0568050.1 polyprenol phosphomannose-dependent alpha 1,6 mannosyltransferase MptB [Williamsia sp. CHRR-6]
MSAATIRRARLAGRRLTTYLGISRPVAAGRAQSTETGDYGATMARIHTDEPEVGDLDARESRAMVRIRLFGAVGSIFILIGSLGTGNVPVLQNPISGVRLLSLPSRMWTTALTLSIAGSVILVLAWLLLGRYAIGRYRTELAHGTPPPRRMTRGQADRTLLVWIIPIVLAPPLLSKDIYSYLAQSAIAQRGMDPYTISPVRGLGVDHVFTRSVPNLWRDTPAPYGPLFLWLGENITRLTGENITAAILMHRLLALAGVALIVWSLPRLARRCGVSPIAALWLGAMNPLLILHLVGGIHNEAMMLGGMLAGIELCFRGIDSAGRLRRVDASGGRWRRWLPSRAGWLLILGAVVITASAMIKITSVLAFAFVGIALARRWGATLPALRHAPVRLWWSRSRDSVIALTAAASALGVVLIASVVLLCVATGLGFGWTSTAGTGSVVRSWMSMPTLLSVTSGRVGVAMGLGDHTQAMLDVARPVAQLAAAVLIVRWMMAALGGRLHPIGALGVSMATVVLFFPFVQPWYLLWAVVPLAAWATGRWFRIGAISISAIIAIVVLPAGAGTRGFQLAEGIIAAVFLVALVTALFFERIPWRRPPVSAPSERDTSATRTEQAVV